MTVKWVPVLFLPAITWAQQPESPDCASPGLAQVADSIAAAFDAHQFVFVGSTHGGKKVHDLLLCLLSRPGFQRRTTDVLVEWGNPVHQRLVDRYLLTLDPLPLDSLRPVWLDTDAPQLWGRLPLIPEFYEAVRAINRQLDPERRIRVLGGCEPIDWSSVRSAADVATYPYTRTTGRPTSSPNTSPAPPAPPAWRRDACSSCMGRATVITTAAP